MADFIHVDHPQSSPTRREPVLGYKAEAHVTTRSDANAVERQRKINRPLNFLWVCFKSDSTPSMLVNLLWPIVPVAISLHFAKPHWHLAIFVTSCFAIVPTANLISFASQGLVSKLPSKPLALVAETTVGSVVEIVLFMILIKKSNGNSNVQIVQGAILGSILANLLLCLGACFIVGGSKRAEQRFNGAVSETVGRLMLIATIALIFPAIFYRYVYSNNADEIASKTISTEKISRGIAVVSIVIYGFFIHFLTVSNGLFFEEVLEQEELQDSDGYDAVCKSRLTLTESVLALVIAIACLILVSLFIEAEIPWMIQSRGLSDAFLGLFLIPLFEKLAEHLLTINEAYNNQLNSVLFHIIGGSLQTTLLNAPLTVLVGWGIGIDMDYNFAIFDVVMLLLTILTVSSLLQHGHANYLKGVMCIMVYAMIVICTYYLPNPT